MSKDQSIFYSMKNQFRKSNHEFEHVRVLINIGILDIFIICMIIFMCITCACIFICLFVCCLSHNSSSSTTTPASYPVLRFPLRSAIGSYPTQPVQNALILPTHCGHTVVHYILTAEVSLISVCLCMLGVYWGVMYKCPNILSRNPTRLIVHFQGIRCTSFLFVI